MSYRSVIKKAAKSLPGAKSLLIRINSMQKLIESQQKEIKQLRIVLGQLEKRNDQWAEEVRLLRGAPQSMKIIWPVKKADIIKADIIKANWGKQKTSKRMSAIKPPYTINWVVPPMGPVSGGHADIFRTINFLESKGHNCRIYFYDAQQNSSLEEIRQNMHNYTSVRSETYLNQEMLPCDAIFATNWYTAYPVKNFSKTIKKFYFVQDFEPYFDPVGTYSNLAENTYKFGFHGVTLGSWLAEKLSTEYGMKCDPIPFGTNLKEYKLTNKGARNKILFYARPVTPRRGFELGILALEEFYKKHPEYEINFIGWDVTPYEIPFPYVNHGILTPKELNKLYNQCIAGLVLSFTNMSLLPLELLASGCVPVVNDAKHTRMVDYAQKIIYSQSTPKAFVDALENIIKKSTAEKIKLSQESYVFAKKFKWDNSNKIVDEVLKRELNDLK